MNNKIITMDRKTNPVNPNTDAVSPQETSANKLNPGFSARVMTGLRTRLRRILKKEDPNIYPFF